MTIGTRRLAPSLHGRGPSLLLRDGGSDRRPQPHTGSSSNWSRPPSPPPSCRPQAPSSRTAPPHGAAAALGMDDDDAHEADDAQEHREAVESQGEPEAEGAAEAKSADDVKEVEPAAMENGVAGTLHATIASLFAAAARDDLQVHVLVACARGGAGMGGRYQCTRFQNAF